MQRKIHGQMSESFLIAGILSISGGLQDAYTYMYRGKVFANAQTGNIVLLAQNLVDRNWQAVLRYFSPLLFFALGVAMAECIRMRYQKAQKIHWRQLVLVTEIVLLFAVGFFPNEMDLLANAMVSFASAQTRTPKGERKSMPKTPFRLRKRVWDTVKRLLLSKEL